MTNKDIRERIQLELNKKNSREQTYIETVYNIEKIVIEAQQQVKKNNIPIVICRCETNDGCTKEEDGNGEYRDYCWKCKCFRN